MSSLSGLETGGLGRGHEHYYANGKTTYECFASGLWNKCGSIQTALKNCTSRLKVHGAAYHVCQYPASSKPWALPPHPGAVWVQDAQAEESHEDGGSPAREENPLTSTPF